MNIFIGIDNGGTAWPSGVCSGDSNGYLAAIQAVGMYSIPEVNVTNNTAANSISSLLCLENSLGVNGTLIGFDMGDEAQCGSQMTSVPSEADALMGYDSTRPIFYNMTDWIFLHGICNPVSQNINALQAVSIGSFDIYPLISPWQSYPGTPQDAMWVQGYSVNQFRQNGRVGEPVWAYVETGSDALGYSSQAGNTCDANTNICTPSNNEFRATPEQVNAEAWMSIINGANGIEWFCHDSSALAFCLGEGGSAKANAVQANLTYVDTTILSFAEQINSSTVGLCTMINGTGFTDFRTSCSDGVLSLAAGSSSMPASALVKSFGGAHYLFAQTARRGSESLTFTLSGDSGKTATVVYDSNAHYDSSNSSVGSTFTLSGSGGFTDTFGANGHDYQVKIYKIQ